MDSMNLPEMTDEGLFALYIAECDRTQTDPSLSDYLVWWEEKYASN